tara:strand:- start:54 stop:452 length:399 start_codon:yes stop_codon:yes gene_type:complete
MTKYKYASCLCKGIDFKIYGELRSVINCHCSQCTKTHGNFASYTSTLKENIIFKSKCTLKWYHSSKKAKRGFCIKCGSSVFFQRNKSDTISISAGLFKNPTDLKTSSNIFIQNKRDYYNINDKLPKFNKYYK